MACWSITLAMTRPWTLTMNDKYKVYLCENQHRCWQVDITRYSNNLFTWKIIWEEENISCSEARQTHGSCSDIGGKDFRSVWKWKKKFVSFLIVRIRYLNEWRMKDKTYLCLYVKILAVRKIDGHWHWNPLSSVISFVIYSIWCAIVQQ